jgi:cysteine desulfurase
MSIYLDHSATTPISNRVRTAIEDVLTTNFGNPSSLHRMGLNAEKSIKDARKKIAKTLKVSDKSVVFTSGGTEANNLAIFGALRKEKGRIITTAFEHPSVLTTLNYLEKEGYDLVYLPLNRMGHIEIDDLRNALSIDTQLVSIMFVNNEIGSIQPIDKIANLIEAFNREHHARIRFHVDAVQAYGKLPINLEKMKIDALTISAHKINGLKGSGALIKSDRLDIKARTFGGGQEQGIRPGTENIIGIVAFGEAAEASCEQMTEDFDHAKNLKQALIQKLTSIEGIDINGEAPQSPYILNVSFEGIKAEVMLHTLEMSGIYVSTGSACHSKKTSQSHVLTAMGLKQSKIEGAIRISFGHSNTIDEIDIAADKLLSSYNDLKKLMKRR